MTDQNTIDRLEAALAANADRAVSAPAPASAPPVAVVVALDGPTGRSVRRRRARTAAVVAVAAVAATFAVGVPLAVQHEGGADRAGTAGAASSPVASAASSTPPAKPVRIGAAEANAALADAADRRAATGDPAVPAGSFSYAETVSAAATVVGTNNQVVPGHAGDYTLDQSWAPADPTDVWTRYQVGVGRGPASGSPSTWSGTCNNIYGETQDAPADVDCATGGRTALLPSYLRTPAASPQVLLDRIRAAVAGDVNPEKVHDVDALVITEIGSDLAGLVVPADLQAQLIRALALLPSAAVLTSVPTFTGRTGLAVQISSVAGTDLPWTDGVILDPTTGRLIGTYSGTPGAADYAPTDVAVAVVGAVVEGSEQLAHTGS